MTDRTEPRDPLDLIDLPELAWYGRHAWMGGDGLEAHVHDLMDRQYHRDLANHFAFRRVEIQCAQEQIESPTMSFPFQPLRWAA